VAVVSVPVAQWVKPLIIGHSARWADGLRTLAGRGSKSGLGIFRHASTSGHAMRLNSRTGVDDSPVSSLLCVL